MTVGDAYLVTVLLAASGYFVTNQYYGKVEPVQTSVEETDTEDSLALSRAEYFTDGTRVPNHLLIPEFRPIILQSAPEHLGLVIRGVMYNSFEALERLGSWNYNVNSYTEK